MTTRAERRRQTRKAVKVSPHNSDLLTLIAEAHLPVPIIDEPLPCCYRLIDTFSIAEGHESGLCTTGDELDPVERAQDYDKHKDLAIMHYRLHSRYNADWLYRNQPTVSSLREGETHGNIYGSI